MVKLDAQLLLDADSLLNSDNISEVKELISAYEHAVDHHNRHCSGHDVYRMQSEMRLRQYVRSRYDEAIRQKTQWLIEDAKQLSLACRVLEDAYDRVEKDLAEWIRTASLRRW